MERVIAKNGDGGRGSAVKCSFSVAAFHGAIDRWVEGNVSF